MNSLEKLKETKIVPVVVFHRVEEVEPTMSALIAGGIPVAEITYRTACAGQCIALATERFPEALIGAGTVIDAEQAEQAIDSGAKFIVSPGLSKEVCEVCREHRIPYIPGVVTPTEILEALKLGLTNLKFFPASVFGGISALKAICAAFPQVRFMPTGGIGLNNLHDFLSFDSVFAVGGSWMVKGTPEEITEKCRESIRVAKGER